MHSQNTAIITSFLNRNNLLVKHLLQALVNAGLFLITKPSLKISGAFKNKQKKAVENQEFQSHQKKTSKSNTISVWSYQSLKQKFHSSIC